MAVTGGQRKPGVTLAFRSRVSPALTTADLDQRGIDTALEGEGSVALSFQACTVGTPDREASRPEGP